jgi:hypothetical protein
MSSRGSVWQLEILVWGWSYILDLLAVDIL